VPVDAGSIYSDVRVRLDKLKGDITAINTEFNKLGTGLGDGAKKAEKTVTESFGKMLASIGALAGIRAVLQKVIGDFASFEQSMANVASVARATPEEFEKLNDAARRAGESTRFSASQAADALYSLASAGLDASESVAALDGVLALASATQSDLAFTSQTVTAALSQFSLEADESGRVANVFSAAIANSQANMEKLSSAFRQVGPVAGALGKSLEETTGALQILFNAGFQGEQAGTILRNVLSQLADTAGPASQKLAELGLDMEKLNPTTNSLADVIGTLSEAGLEAGEVIRAFGTEAGPGLLTLLNEGRSGMLEFTAAVTGTNSAAETSVVQMDTLQGSLDQLKSATESLAIGIGTGLAPLLRILVDALTGIINIVNQIPNPLKAMGFAAGTAALGIHAGAQALAALGVSITVSLGPISLIAAGIVAIGVATAALVKHNNDLKEQRIAKEYQTMSEAVGLTGKQIIDVGEQFRIFNTYEVTTVELMIKQAEELAEKTGKTVPEILKIASAYKGLKSDVRETVLEAQRIAQAHADAEKAAKEQIEDFRQIHEIKKKIFDDQRIANEQEKAARIEAIADEKRKAEEQGKAREKALRATIDAIEILNFKAEQGLITQEQRIDGVNKAYEAEIDALLALGYTLEGNFVGSKRLQELINKITDGTQALSDASNDSAYSEKENIDAIQNALNKSYEAKKKAHEEEMKRIQAEKEARLAVANLVLNFTLQGLSILDQANQLALDKKLAQIDAELQAKLQAEGLAEETTLQRLEKELEEAVAAGDEEKILEAQKAVDREKIIQEFEKKKAKIEYETALRSWGIQLLQATAQAIQAALNTYSSTAAIPLVGPALAPGAAAVAGAFGAAQVALVAAAKPEAPKFQTGGIVPGSSFSGDNVLIRANSGEAILNAETQKRLADFLFGGGSAFATGNPSPVVVPVYFQVPGMREYLIGQINVGLKNGEIIVDARQLTNIESVTRR
jgi:TP901 family phage tail tape measure protein